MIRRLLPRLFDSVAVCFAMLFLCIAPAFWIEGPALAQTRQLSNLGTDFYVAYGPNEGGDESHNVMDLYIASKVQAHGTVEIPALAFFQSFTTTPGQITTIHLPNGNNRSRTVEITSTQTVVHGMAIHITSDSEVAVFGLNHKLYSSDAFMGFPSTVLGTEYRTINYTTSALGQQSTPGEFWIVGVQDSTNITITLHDHSSKGTPANTPFAVRLNKGDTYLVQGDLNNASNDLTGSLIESDQPIAVFSGHMRTAIPGNAKDIDGSTSRDHLVEELPPVSAWGDSALVVPYATSALPDLVRVVCAEDGTQITINGQPLGQTFNAGDFYEITQLAGVTSIQASKPILVGQFMHTSKGALNSPTNPAYGDPALGLVFPVEQFTTSYTILSIIDPVSFTGNFVNIVADASSIGSMQLDGNPINPAEFKPIPNTRFVYAQHALVQGAHNLTCNAPFGITIYALGPVDSYAYTGGTLLKTITPLETVGLSIDFGDRVLTAPNFLEKFDSTVYLKNVSEDTVNIYAFPRRIQDTDRFYVTAPNVSQAVPHTIGPGKLDSMTIEFYPHEVNRRMHTQITAETDHLRAYVVDVYGRGVVDSMGVFRDSQKVYKIDTLDFGLFTNASPPADSAVYVGNAGLTKLNIQSIAVTGGNAADFTTTQFLYQGIPVTLPFAINEPPSSALLAGVRFIPTGLPNGTYTTNLDITTSSGGKLVVVLVGHVETISALAPSVGSVTFGTTFVCSDSSFNIPISNPNDVPITLTNVTIAGADPGDFALGTKVPLVIPAGQTVSVSVHFLPTGRGLRSAQAALQFDLPKNAPAQYVNLSGMGDKYSIVFAASQNVTSYATDNFLVPIYARTDLTPFSPIEYTMHVFYDTSYLKLLDVVTTNTLTPAGYFGIFNSTPPGNDTVRYSQAEGSGTPITGGGPSSSTPFLYLKFQPLLPGVDPQTFTKAFTISYDVELSSSLIPAECVEDTFENGTVQIVSICSDPHITTQSQTLPQVMLLGQSSPNPFTPSTTMEYDVATEVPVKIEVFDATGTLVRVLVDETKSPGYYYTSLDGTGLPSGAYLIQMSAGEYHRMRRVILSK
jgi:hypothetical protein